MQKPVIPKGQFSENCLALLRKYGPAPAQKSKINKYHQINVMCQYTVNGLALFHREVKVQFMAPK